MPLNEILAASTVIVKYTTVGTNEDHEFRLYFDSVPTPTGDDGAYEFPTYTDAEHTGGWLVRDVVDEVWSRANAHAGGIQSSNIGAVEIYENVSGENIFLGFDPADYDDVGAGSVSGVAAAYLMHVFQDNARNQFRLTIFDTVTASPQRFPAAPAPAEDDDSLEWFFTRSAIMFVTNDDNRIVRLNSWNTGYNRKLARSYGRQKTP